MAYHGRDGLPRPLSTGGAAPSTDPLFRLPAAASAAYLLGMTTRAAAAALEWTDLDIDRVATRRALTASGCPTARVTANVAAGRWQRLGVAYVLHNGPLTRHQRWRVALLNCGPRAVLAGFTAAEALGLRGWERDLVHVLAPAGVAPPRVDGVGIRLHRTRRLRAGSVLAVRRCQLIDPALALAAGTFQRPRPAVGLVAAGVQQRLTTAFELRAEVEGSARLRHRSQLLRALDDIEMGAQALSEIDFARVCRRAGLAEPERQTVRLDPRGRRRYLDAFWRLRDGRTLTVEVDGALHLAPLHWFADQLRQNEVTLSGTMVLRYPSVVLRTEEATVVDQLRRALLGAGGLLGADPRRRGS